MSCLEPWVVALPGLASKDAQDVARGDSLVFGLCPLVFGASPGDPVQNFVFTVVHSETVGSDQSIIFENQVALTIAKTTPMVAFD